MVLFNRLGKWQAQNSSLIGGKQVNNLTSYRRRLCTIMCRETARTEFSAKPAPNRINNLRRINTAPVHYFPFVLNEGDADLRG
jgi:hypothetical protein